MYTNSSIMLLLVIIISTVLDTAEVVGTDVKILMRCSMNVSLSIKLKFLIGIIN